MKQELFYPFYKDFDKQFFDKVLEAWHSKYRFVGSSEEKAQFVKDLLYFQLIKEYRQPLEIVYEGLSEETNLHEINAAMSKVDFSLDFSWASFLSEKQMLEDAQNFRNLELTFEGTDEQYNEFVLRYLLSIWLADWQGPLYALLVETRSGHLNLKDLNELLALWDFTGEFC